MTLSPWLVYLWGIADNAREACLGFWLFSMAGTAAACVFYPLLCNYRNTGPEGANAFLRKCVIACGVFGLLLAVLPSSKTVAIMVIAPAIVNSDPIQKDLPEIYNAAVEALKEQLKSSK